MGTEIWGKEVANYIFHAYIAMNYGKTSLKELSIEELQGMLDWLKEEIYGQREDTAEGRRDAGPAPQTASI
ncbi:MAG: hypothetical protein JRD89_00220 [Deltaproteobacteria bacterium]|nr:hypothetical protein [Deltaproteobacteria bacterium]